jgi:hypothetical protein
MNVYLIKASAPGPFKEYKKAMGAPPQNIFSVAAATPEGVGIDMCDETIGMKPKMNTKADIVALFFHTPDAPHSYKLADQYRAKGKTVVLGGLQPTIPISPLTINAAGSKMEFREYRGKYEGEKVIAHIGYVANQTCGYSVVGVFGEKDYRMKDVINRTLTSFRLTKM